MKFKRRFILPSLFYLLKGDGASLKLVSSNNLIKVVETIKKKFATKEEVNKAVVNMENSINELEENLNIVYETVEG